MTKRKTPSDLVSDAKAETTEVAVAKSEGDAATDWHVLDKKDSIYVCMVLNQMRDTPGASPYSVARALKKELGLAVSHETIAKTLKGLLADDQKKNSK